MEKLRRIVNIVLPGVMLLNTCLSVGFDAGWKFILYTLLAAGWGVCIGLEVGRIVTEPKTEEMEKGEESKESEKGK